MNTLSVLVKATVNTTDMNSFHSYIKGLMQLYEKHAVKKVSQYEVREVFIGTELPTFISVYSFKDRNTFDAVYQSDEYRRQLLPLRQKAFSALEVYICG